MRKIKILLISLISIFAFNINVFAASGNLSVSSGNVYVGDRFTVTANINSAAAWNVKVSATGPVSGCSIVQADATDNALDTNKAFSTTCTATGEGTITIRMSGDVTSASDGNAVNISGSKSVNVSKRITLPNNNNNINTNNNTNNNINENTDNQSKNTGLKELSVDGYKLVKVNANNYTLSVPNDVSSINVKATAEDSKSKIRGTGNHNIKVGENNIEIIITSESGQQNKINIKVTRKDGYYLEDLDSALKNNKLNDINITIKADTKISSEILEKIKNSKKVVRFNYYNANKVLTYSWIIDGSKITNTHDISTLVSYESENKKDILRLANYADGLFAHTKQSNNLPQGTKIKLYVGNKFANNDLVNIYAYTKNNSKLKFINNKIKVENGYIEFDAVEASDYLITMSTIPNSTDVIKKTPDKQSSIIIPILISIIIVLVIAIIIIIIFILKKNKIKKDDNSERSWSCY